MSETLSVCVPLAILVGGVVSGTTGTAGLLAAHTTWRAAWFVPPFWRLMQVFSVLLLSTLPLLIAAAVHGGRPGAPLLLILLAAAVLLARRRPIVGLLGVVGGVHRPWAPLWPVPAMHEDQGRRWPRSAASSSSVGACDCPSSSLARFWPGHTAG